MLQLHFSVSREFFGSESYDELALSDGLEIFDDPRLDVIMPIIGRWVLDTHGADEAEPKIEEFMDTINGPLSYTSERAAKAHNKDRFIVLEPDEDTAKLLQEQRIIAQEIFDIDIYIKPSRPPIIATERTNELATETLDTINKRIKEMDGVISLPFSAPGFKPLYKR